MYHNRSRHEEDVLVVDLYNKDKFYDKSDQVRNCMDGGVGKEPCRQ